MYVSLCVCLSVQVMSMQSAQQSQQWAAVAITANIASTDGATTAVVFCGARQALLLLLRCCRLIVAAVRRQVITIGRLTISNVVAVFWPLLGYWAPKKTALATDNKLFSLFYQNNQDTQFRSTNNCSKYFLF